MSEIEKARKLLKEERRKRVEACQQAIFEVLQRYDCRLAAVLQTNLGDLNVPIAIVARTETNDS
jgi:hypothetical protein